MKKTLYLCGSGNPEGVRLALLIDRAQDRWERIVILDDDPAKHGHSILGIEIAGPFSLLAQADPEASEAVNLVARTTRRRQGAWEKIRAYRIPAASLIDPQADLLGVEAAPDVIVNRGVLFCAGATVGEQSVLLPGSVIGHGCQVGRFCIVAPGAVLNARVVLGEGAYVGTNASILPDLEVGAWATVGANSAVLQSVSPGATVMGVPAKVLIEGEIDPPPVGSDPLSRLRQAQLEFLRDQGRSS